MARTCPPAPPDPPEAHPKGCYDFELVAEKIEPEPLLPTKRTRAQTMQGRRPVIAQAPFDKADCPSRDPDVRRGVEEKRLASGQAHDVGSFHVEGRFATPVPPVFA